MAAQPADAQDTRYQVRLDFLRMWELTKSFRFEAAHALPGTTLGDASMEIHGHSFRAEVSDPRHARSRDRHGDRSRPARAQHGGGAENRSTTSCSTRSRRWARRRWKTCRASSGSGSQHAGKLARVSVHRDSCNESCTYFGPQGRSSFEERATHPFRSWHDGLLLARMTEKLGTRMDMSVIEDRKTRARAGSSGCATTSARPSRNWKTTRRPRSIRAPRDASCARPGTAPTTPASPAAAA